MNTKAILVPIAIAFALIVAVFFGVSAQAALVAESSAQAISIPSTQLASMTSSTIGPAKYRVGFFAEPATENVWMDYEWGGGGARWTQGSLYLTLYRYSTQEQQMIPYLAADFPTKPVKQGQYWVTHMPLKQGANWSDGVEITAQDVVFTANSVRELGLGDVWTGYHEPLHHIEANSAYTVTFYFTQEPGLISWLSRMATPPIMARHYWEPIIAQALAQPDAQGWLANYAPVGEPTSGPFKRSLWVQGNYIEHVVNPLYYFRGLEVTEYTSGAYYEMLPGKYEFSAYGKPGGEVAVQYVEGPYVTNVSYTLYNSWSEATQALIIGQVDYVLDVFSLTATMYNQLSAQPDIQGISNPSSGFRYLSFNQRRTPLDQVALRQAVATLIDREFIAEEIGTTHFGQPIYPVWSPVLEGNTFWYTPTVRVGEGLTRQERISATVELLTGAGFSWTVEPGWDPIQGAVIPGQGLQFGGEAVPILELVAPNYTYDPLRASAAISISTWLSEAGIQTTPSLLDWEDLLVRVFNQQDFDLMILGWTLGANPNYLCDFFMSTKGEPGGDNAGGYSNPVLDAKCAEFLAESNPATGQQIAYELQAILADDMPYVTLFTTPVLEVYRSDKVAYPYLKVLGGLSNFQERGLPSLVKLVPTTAAIPTTGGVVNAPGSSLTFPAGAFAETVNITYTTQSIASGLPSAGIFFSIEATYASSGQPAQLLPGATYTMVVHYDENALPAWINEATLKLHVWDTEASNWVPEPTSSVNPSTNTLTANPNRFGLWTALGSYRIYLPMAERK